MKLIFKGSGCEEDEEVRRLPPSVTDRLKTLGAVPTAMDPCRTVIRVISSVRNVTPLSLSNGSGLRTDAAQKLHLHSANPKETPETELQTPVSSFSQRHRTRIILRRDHTQRAGEAASTNECLSPARLYHLDEFTAMVDELKGFNV